MELKKDGSVRKSRSQSPALVIRAAANRVISHRESTRDKLTQCSLHTPQREKPRRESSSLEFHFPVQACTSSQGENLRHFPSRDHTQAETGHIQAVTLPLVSHHGRRKHQQQDTSLPEKYPNMTTKAITTHPSKIEHAPFWEQYASDTPLSQNREYAILNPSIRLESSPPLEKENRFNHIRRRGLTRT